MVYLKGKEMSKEDHPSFRYKDTSNKRQPSLFDLPDLKQIMQMGPEEIRKLEIDIIFWEMILAEWQKP